LRLAFSCCVVVAFIVTVCVVVCLLMTFKFLSKEWFGVLGGPIGGVTNAVSIMVFNLIYGRVVEQLNDMENWRTETEHDDHKILKDFAFKFVNAYAALFFVAFVQNHTLMLFGIDMHCPNYHCMPVLTMTLGTVFATQIVVQQTLEVAVPWLKYRRKMAVEEKKLASKLSQGDKVQKPTRWEMESAMEEYPGVFDDYNEMVVQFGYVTLFTAAFPLTSFFALLNNVIEIRVDAVKLIEHTRRPRYHCAADIGMWATILDKLAVVAIFTNVSLVGFTSHGLYFFFPHMTPTDRLHYVIVIEHALLLLKWAIESLIPDVPPSVLENYQKQIYRRDRAVENFLVRLWGCIG